MNTIYEAFVSSGYVEYECIVNHCDRTLRVVMHSDSSYPNQSRATVCLWTPAGWTNVHNPHPMSMVDVWKKANPNHDAKTVKTLMVNTSTDMLELAFKIVAF